MNQLQVFLLISNVLVLIFAQSFSNHTSVESNMLLRSADDIFVSDVDSTNNVRIEASFFIIDCQLLPNTHLIIRINEGDDVAKDAIPNEFLVNGIETSDEIFEVITFKTPNAPRTSIKATHALCDKNDKHCQYYDFSRN